MLSIVRVWEGSLSRHQARDGQRPPGPSQSRRHRLAEDGGPVLLRSQAGRPEGRGPVHHRVRRERAGQGPREEVHTGGDRVLLAVVGGQGRVHEEHHQDPGGLRPAGLHWRRLEHERRGGDSLRLHHRQHGDRAELAGGHPGGVRRPHHRLAD